MALLTSFPTEVLVKKETRWGVEDGQWVREWRNTTITTTRYVFSTLEEAETYLKSIVNADGVETDGVARVINDVGWAECITLTTTEGEWTIYEQ